jgi:hypothetical protein
MTTVIAFCRISVICITSLSSLLALFTEPTGFTVAATAADSCPEIFSGLTALPLNPTADYFSEKIDLVKPVSMSTQQKH